MRIKLWRLVSRVLLLSLFITAVVSSIFTWHVWDIIDTRQHQQISEDQALQQKVLAFSALRKAIGYGGLIQQFENDVLRGEAQLVEHVEQEYARINSAIQAYRRLSLSATASTALDTLEATLARYYANFRVARDMRSGDQVSAEQVGKVVRIDDKAAIQALDTLDHSLQAAFVTVRQRHQQNAAHIQGLFPLIVTLTGILVLTAGVLIFFTLGLDRSFRRASESEARYRNILNTAVDSIICIDASGTISNVNPACERIFGYQAAELKGQNVKVLMPSPYADEHDTYIQRYLAEGTPRVVGSSRTVPAKRKDGSIFTAELSISEAKENARQLFIGILRDVTQQMAMETELKRREALFKGIFNDSPDALIVADTERRISMCNPALLDLFGYAQADIIGQKTLMLYADPQDFAEQGRLRFNVSVAKKRSPYVVRYRRQDGHIFFGETVGTPLSDSDGNIIGFLGSVRDISARLAADKELERHRANLAKAQKIAKLGSWEWDIVNDSLYWSDEIYRIFGQPPHAFEPSYEAFFAMVHVNDKALVKRSEEQAFKTGTHDVEHRISLSDGSIRWVHELAQVEFAEDGKPTRMTGVVQDISERKANEQALQRRTESLKLLSEIAADPSYAFGNKLQKALQMVLAYFDLDLGIISHVEDQVYTVQYVEMRDPKLRIQGGQLFELGQTYCDLAIQQMDVLAIDHMGVSAYAKHPCYEAGLEAYIGAPFNVRGAFYGTVNFSRLSPYSRQFDAADKELIRILARWCGMVIERAWAYEELRQSEERFERSQQFANIGTWDWNIQSGELYWSERIAPLFGYESGELETTYDNFLNAVHEHDRNKVIDAVNGCIKHGVEYNIEHRVAWPDGTIRWLSEKGDVVRDSDNKAIKMLGVVQDITQRRLYQEQLTRFEQVVESTSHAISIANMDGIIIYTNQAHRALLDDPNNRAFGQNWENLIPQSAAKKLAHIHASFQKHQGWRGLMPVKTFSGLEFVSYSTMGMVFDENDKPRFVFNIFYDYTAELDRQQELQNARDEAEQANRAKSEFLSSMSHELRTPLNSILGFGQLLINSRKEPLTERQHAHTSHILKSGRHLLELINEVLDFAKIEAGRLSISMENVNSGLIVSDAINLVSALAAQRNIELSTGCELKQFPTIYADRTRFRQVLLNLLSNAIKYNHERGTVEIDWHNVDDKRVRFEVKDTGPGIKMDEQNDLFEPFNRLHAENSSIEGTGIGLALSKKLMQMMDGTIGCISQPGEGATFWVEFARRDKDGQNPELTDKQLDPKALKTYQGMILYVEDNPDNLTLMEEIIAEETAYQLLTAPTAEIGLSLARQHHPDVIILDINLPGMDGIETMKIIKADAALKQIPVFALSANVTDNTVQHALAAGFQAYLNKPLDVDVLLKALEVAVV